MLDQHRPEAARPADKVVRHGKPTIRTLREDIARTLSEESTDDGVVRLKSLRPTFVTHLALLNVPLSTAAKRARHSDPKITMRHDLKVGLLDLHGAVDVLGEINAGTNMEPNSGSKSVPERPDLALRGVR